MRPEKAAGKGKPSSRRAEYFPSTTRTAILPPVLAIFFFLSLYLLKTAYPTELLACLPILCSVVGI